VFAQNMRDPGFDPHPALPLQKEKMKELEFIKIYDYFMLQKNNLMVLEYE
jgi:hypothetical protein